MSGAVTVQGVETLRRDLADYRSHAEIVQRLCVQLEQIRSGLPVAKEKMVQARDRVLEGLKKMDCASTGNFGWEGRFLALLNELDIGGRADG